MLSVVPGPARPGAWETVRRLGTALFRSLPLRVSRPDGAGLGDIAAVARACARDGGLALLVVDCLQLVEVEQSRSITREQAVASVSRGLKNLSVQLGCHVIALSQLNDDAIMRESRAIKNDASIVIKAERPDAGEKEIAPSRRGRPRDREEPVRAHRHRDRRRAAPLLAVRGDGRDLSTTRVASQDSRHSLSRSGTALARVPSI
ncbi:hypothetical protein GCM10010371_66370 [Streptomyces subrutilus]|uniref:SF4 helicase domain-containing protein n=1 Tax=Streptomyces subrutilus TaxID=36818 RepID=A0A918VGJ6_9ACTN|nr:DnaB-like helicase C-terminal domain-containing protein [Streptomyces subrutilus]GGZ97224.1 hypothetical protein GCM10010371_66370 [Streptomyces subrutilus]